MRSGLVFTLALAAALGSASALNPIHESSYSLLPRGNFSSNGTFSVAGIFRAHTEAIAIPASMTFAATPRLELGGGLKTIWGDGIQDNFQYLDFGAKYRIPGATSLQADFLLGVTSGAGNGLALTAYHRFGYSSRFYSRLAGRLGFMDAIVDGDAFMALEGAFYPTVDIARPLSLELGLIASSQTTDFDSHFAFDLQPALLVHIGGESVVETAVALGLAGDRKEDLRVKVTLIYGF